MTTKTEKNTENHSRAATPSAMRGAERGKAPLLKTRPDEEEREMEEEEEEGGPPALHFPT